MSEKEFAQSISLNRLNVTQAWLDKNLYSKRAKCPC